MLDLSKWQVLNKICHDKLIHDRDWKIFKFFPVGTSFYKAFKAPSHSYIFYNNYELRVEKISEEEAKVTYKIIGDNPSEKYNEDVINIDEFIRFMNNWRTPPSWLNNIRLKIPVVN